MSGGLKAERPLRSVQQPQSMRLRNVERAGVRPFRGYLDGSCCMSRDVFHGRLRDEEKGRSSLGAAGGYPEGAVPHRICTQLEVWRGAICRRSMFLPLASFGGSNPTSYFKTKEIVDFGLSIADVVRQDNPQCGGFEIGCSALTISPS